MSQQAQEIREAMLRYMQLSIKNLLIGHDKHWPCRFLMSVCSRVYTDNIVGCCVLVTCLFLMCIYFDAGNNTWADFHTFATNGDYNSTEMINQNPS